MTHQVQAYLFCFLTTQQKTWVSTFCLSADEALGDLASWRTEWYPRKVLLIHPWVCVEGMVNLHAHNGIHIFSIPVTSYSALSLTCKWNFRGSISHSTKHRVTLFYYIVHYPILLALTRAIIEQMRCKVTKLFWLTTKSKLNIQKHFWKNAFIQKCGMIFKKSEIFTKSNFSGGF